jgi:hypothetical protein
MNTYKYILTRFNLKLWQTDKNSRDTQTDEWLEQRFRLFEQFTLPSVLNQTDKNFRWIVLFSSDTPTKYKCRIEEIRSRCQQFRAIGVAPEQSTNFSQIFREVVESDLDGMPEGMVSTTYLDNDDALSANYMKSIGDIAADLQKKGDTAKPTFINFIYGCQYFTEYKTASTACYKRNHFISLIEPTNSVKTVFGYGSHYYLKKQSGVKEIKITKRDMWLEVIHSTNVINDVRTSLHTRIIDSNRLYQAFGIKAETLKGTIKPALYIIAMKVKQKLKLFGLK